MAIQIINCPSCDTFLLEDTAECPECGHVVHAVRAEETQRRSLPTDAAVDDDMEACPKCGETCRQGLVRCWSCGSFLKAEIEASYLSRRKSAPISTVQTFDLEVIEESSVTGAAPARRRHLATPESFLATAPLASEEDQDDDFELAGDVHMSEADDDAFDLAETVQLRMEGDDSEFTDEPMFRLQEPAYSLPGTAPAELHPAMVEELGGGDLDTIPLMSSEVSSENNPIADTFTSLEPAKIEPAAPQVSPEDELLKIAAAEEVEIARARKGATSQPTFVVFCPQGHRIRVREKFRGKSGKCPKCESAFVVPSKPKPNAKKKTDPELAVITAGGSAATGRFAEWLTDVRLHTVVPEKLKLKADSLLNDFQPVDVGLGADELLLVTLVGSAGMFGSNLKKKPAIRSAMLEHLAKPDATLDGLAVATKRQYAKETLAQLTLVQPAPLDSESLFGNIPVFGGGRIAVRLPKGPEDKYAQYLSFVLSEFRAFTQALHSVCGIEGFGANTEIPLTDHYESFKCHYSESSVRDLASIGYYRNDPNFKIEIGGWKCAGCGLIVSEEARKKEKLGGLNGKGLAKAKCPKCTQKFGSNALVQLAAAEGASASARASQAATGETPSIE